MRIRTLFMVAIATQAVAAALFHGCGLYTDGIHAGAFDASMVDSGPADSGDACTSDGCGECPPGRGECDGDPATVCETSLATSDHCGACGHSCLGGACERERCQPFLLASIAAASELAVGDGGVAVTSRSTGSVYFVPTSADGGSAIDGGAVLVASSQTNVNGPSEDGTSIYWAVFQVGGAVGRGLRGGGPTTPLVATSQSPESTVVVGDYVYWLNYTSGTVLRAKRSTPTVAEAVVLGSGSTEIALVTDGTQLYWVDDTTHTIFAAPIGGGTARPVATVPAVGAASAVVPGSDGNLYVVARATLANPEVGLFRVPQNTDGGTATLLARSASTAGTSRIATDDRYVYFTDSAKGTVWRLTRDAPPIALDGGVPEAGAEIVATGQVGVEGIRVDSQAIYWTTATGLVRLAK